jgi:hypothetical protein
MKIKNKYKTGTIFVVVMLFGASIMAQCIDNEQIVLKKVSDLPHISTPLWRPCLPFKDSSVTNKMFFKTPTYPHNMATWHWGFFCKQELKWANSTRVPIKFSLGTAANLDRLEGKCKTIQ